jgi:hypothetical protein
MLALVGAVGTTIYVYTPQPGDRTMLDLRDAGILLGQPVAVLADEKDVSRQTGARLRRLQGAEIIRPRQRYFRMLRAARCFGDSWLDGGVGNCVRPDGGLMEPFTREVQEWRFTTTLPTEDGGTRAWLRISDETAPESDGGVFATLDHRNDGGTFTRSVLDPKQAELSIQSLRQDLDGGALVSDGGDTDSDSTIDDAQQLHLTILHCAQVDDIVDAGVFRNPYGTRFCAGLNRVAVQPEPCMMPNGWRAGGGWCEEACGVVDCKGVGPYGREDGGARWRGFNVTPREFAVGADCVPVACGVVAGDVPQEWL